MGQLRLVWVWMAHRQEGAGSGQGLDECFPDGVLRRRVGRQGWAYRSRALAPEGTALGGDTLLCRTA